jgi:hypothetical protein
VGDGNNDPACSRRFLLVLVEEESVGSASFATIDTTI